MIHLFAVSKLVNHDHHNPPLWQPLSLAVPQHQLYHLPSVEIPANEFVVEGKLLKRLHKNHVLLHEGIAYCGNAVEDAFSGGGRRPGERLDKVYEGVRTLCAFVDALEPERHGIGCRAQQSSNRGRSANREVVVRSVE
jgi:hypothetical protein